MQFWRCEFSARALAAFSSSAFFAWLLQPLSFSFRLQPWGRLPLAWRQQVRLAGLAGRQSRCFTVCQGYGNGHKVVAWVFDDVFGRNIGWRWSVAINLSATVLPGHCHCAMLLVAHRSSVAARLVRINDDGDNWYGFMVSPFLFSDYYGIAEYCS